MQEKKIYIIILTALITGTGFFGFFMSNDPDNKTTVNDYINSGGSISHTENIGWLNETDVVPMWTSGTNMPAPTRYHGAGVSYTRNDTSWLYCFGGDNTGSGGNSPVVSIYNITANTWSTGDSMPPTLVFYTSAARLGSTAYIVGGIGPGGAFTSMVNEVKRYNIATNTWLTNAANYPTTVADGKACGYQDSLIYVVGGIVNGTTSGTNQVNVYNSISNTWRTATALPVARSGGAMTICGDTIVYVAGGTGYGLGLSNAVYRGVISQSDRSVITWTTGSNFPGTYAHRFDAAPWGCQGIIVSPGSGQGFSTSNTVWRYSPGANVWFGMPNCLTNVAVPFLGSCVKGNIWKLVMASGLRVSNPYSIPNVQILTDTICPLVGINPSSEIIPGEYSLSQNYPNPFNPVTNIKFSLLKAGLVKLVVFNVLGKEVTTLVNEYKNAGVYEVSFDASVLSSGVYFYRLEAGDFSAAKRMLLVK